MAPPSTRGDLPAPPLGGILEASRIRPAAAGRGATGGITGGSHGSRSTHRQRGDGSGIERRRHGRPVGTPGRRRGGEPGVGGDAPDEGAGAHRPRRHEAGDPDPSAAARRASGQGAALVLRPAVIARRWPTRAGRPVAGLPPRRGGPRPRLRRAAPDTADRSGSSPTSATSLVGVPAPSCSARRAPASWSGASCAPAGPSRAGTSAQTSRLVIAGIRRSRAAGDDRDRSRRRS